MNQDFVTEVKMRLGARSKLKLMESRRSLNGESISKTDSAGDWKMSTLNFQNRFFGRGVFDDHAVANIEGELFAGAAPDQFNEAGAAGGGKAGTNALQGVGGERSVVTDADDGDFSGS